MIFNFSIALRSVYITEQCTFDTNSRTYFRAPVGHYKSGLLEQNLNDYENKWRGLLQHDALSGRAWDV
jgi:hypothetical protein